MKYDCDVIRDLLPLYADSACSNKSSEMVEEHLQECPECRRQISMLRETEIEDALYDERDSVIQYGVRQLRRRSAVVGSAVSGTVMIPMLIIVLMNLIVGPSLNWVSIVLAALCVAASLVLVPLLVAEDKAFWTFCAFCASLMLLLAVVCLYSKGDWFWIASSASLFGLSVVFLPFVIRARPVRKLIGTGNRLLIVLCVDAALFFNMLNMLSTRGKVTLNGLLFTIALIGGIALVLFAIIKKGRIHRGS